MTRWPLRCLPLVALVVDLTVGACSGKTAPQGKPAVDDLDVTIPHATAPDAMAPVAAVAIDAGPAELAQTGSAAAPVTATAGQDFIEDGKLLYRVAACGGADSPLPDAITTGDPKRAAALTKLVDRHCKWITERLEKFRAKYFVKARSWFDAVVPKDVPKTVVYPFGGGDLLSALVAFPEATEITTISLELAGDPRRLRALPPPDLERSLAALRLEIGGLIDVGSNTSENLSAQQQNELPGQVSSFLLGLVAAGYEPVAMRFFKLDDTGEIDYHDAAEIQAIDTKPTKSRKHDWQSPNFSDAFAHVEITYRRPGDTTVRTHRHFGWNLADSYLAKHPQLIRHLEKKGKVTLLTKGASYLLWRNDFSTIRNYMVANLAWMLSDSTGIPPVHARAAKLVQDTYGTYTGAFLAGARTRRHDADFVELWETNRRRRLAFRFGYLDMDKNAHLVVTRPR